MAVRLPALAPRAVALLLLLMLAAWAQAALAQTFPSLTGRVVDEAGLLSAEESAAITAKLATLDQQTGRQVVVVTLKDLQGYDIADYGYRLGRAWGIGEKETNSGALLIIAPNQRRMRIEVGYGLEGVLTDALSSRIINETIVPRFKAGDMPGGIMAGTDALVSLLTLPPEEQRKVVAEAERSGGDQGGGFFTLLFLLFILFFVVLPILRSGRRGKRRRRAGPWGAPPIIIWGPGDWHDDNRGGWGGGGWGGGGGGFGGFSGGGGSFGGGGASGGW